MIVADKAKDPDRHGNPGVLARPDTKLRDQAREILDARGWTMNEFLIACLVLLTENPDAMLKRLTQFKPERKNGRPKKKAPPATDG